MQALECRTLVHLLQERARGENDRLAYSFLSSGQEENSHIKYSELDMRARTIAIHLQAWNAQNHCVLLLCPPGLDYIAAFFGCLYAGAIAVPIYPPRNNRSLARLQGIVHDTQAAIVLTTTSVVSHIQVDRFLEFKALKWISVDSLPDVLADTWQIPDINTDTLAFLQYTSGSTAEPRGVKLTHGNLLHNLALIHNGFANSQESSGVIWLPPFHDMGLIGGILQPLFGGFPVTLMSPTAFLQSPRRWLETISSTRSTISGGPNFAYDLCVQKITPEQRATLDLSCWKVAFTGAEPIRPVTLRQFVTAFAPCGFRMEAFYPCYGLAEATLIVSGSNVHSQPTIRAFNRITMEQNHVSEVSFEHENASSLVSSGSILADTDALIVNPQSLTKCQENEVGEIWVKGTSVAQGYWKQEIITKEIFQARLSDTGKGPFLRTGDVGFIYKGELFITSRLKDLIIIRGRNYYPQDIECLIEQCHVALRPNSGAAFSLEQNGEECLIVVQEVKRQYQQIDVNEVTSAIIQAVSEQHDVLISDIVFIKQNSLPKTSSGKIQRVACRKSYLMGTLEIVAAWHRSAVSELAEQGSALIVPPITLTLESLQEWLTLLFAAKLGIDAQMIDKHTSILSYGLDSLIAVDIIHDIATSLNISFPLEKLLKDSSILQMAEDILIQLSSPLPSATFLPILNNTTKTDDPYRLSYRQQALWFLHQLAPQDTAYNVVGAACIQPEVDVAALQRAFQVLIERHECLRTTFFASSQGTFQRVHKHIENFFEVRDAFYWDSAQLESCLSCLAHQPFDLEQGPLIRVVLFKRPAKEYVLLLVIHHMVVDFWSLSLLLHELGVLYGAEKKGEKFSLPSLSIQYADYVYWEFCMLSRSEGERLWEYWQHQLANIQPTLDLPIDRPRPPVQTFRGASFLFKLNRTLTAQLKVLSQHHEVTIYMVLLAAFDLLLYHYTDQDDILVGSETAGRISPDFAPLVGLLANPVVMRADLSGDPTFELFLRQVRQTVLEALEHQHFPFSLLVERLQPKRDSSRSPVFQAVFNFYKSHLPEQQSLVPFMFSEQEASMKFGDTFMRFMSVGQQVAHSELALAMAEIDGELIGEWKYNTDIFEPSTIVTLSKHFTVLLENVVEQPQQRFSSILAPISTPKLGIVIASTFTANLLEEPISFWMERLGIPFRLRFAPYGQIFEQLMDPSSVMATNKGAYNILVIRIEDWLQASEMFEGNGSPQVDREHKLFSMLNNFISALEVSVDSMPATYLLSIVPMSLKCSVDAELKRLILDAEAMVSSKVKTMSGIHLLDVSLLASQYQVTQIHDRYTDSIAHIPFTEEYFVALGTLFARTIHAMHIPSPYKVIVLDCDHTLWRGICGEDGWSHVNIDGPYQFLQQFMLKQYEQGLLLCMCSKNNAMDVFEVFQHREEMHLTLEHFVSWRINWQPKSENLYSLAEELNLGVDSFIFIDDDPRECELVAQTCLGTFVLCLPENAEDIPALLEHIWEFDRVPSTQEDRKRTLLYRENAQREQLKRELLTTESFIEHLGLQISISSVQNHQLERVAQLTQRTNQFNFTTGRRSVNEIAQFLGTQGTECWVVDVSDRFGAYGLVGVMMTQVNKNVLYVDTFLISCRVIGKKIEHKMFLELVVIAKRHCCTEIHIPYISTPKNVPAFHFLKQLNSQLDQSSKHIQLNVFPLEGIDTILLPLQSNKRGKNDIFSS